jgi:hypothetical protein
MGESHLRWSMICVLSLAACGGDGGGNGDDGPPIQVGDCDGLGAVGEWQDITPPQIMPPEGESLAAFAFAVDPVHSGTVYFGTANQQMWKSTNCGATWARIGIGPTEDPWEQAMNWTFLVDPIAPDTVYTNTGYGSHGNGLWKSTDQGATWNVIWPPANQPDLAAHLTYQFANVVVMDPEDHLHLLLTFHEECRLDDATTCIAETTDGGATWTLVKGQPGWNGNEGQILYFLDDEDTWLWGSQTNGFFRTDNHGASWTEVHDENGDPFFTSHLQGSGMYKNAAGIYHLAAGNGLYRSPDGITWTLVPDTGPIGGGIVSDGDTMYYGRCYFGDFCEPRGDLLLTSPEADGLTWTPLPSPDMRRGGSLAYDLGHDLLYSSNGESGFWRVVTR